MKTGIEAFLRDMILLMSRLFLNGEKAKAQIAEWRTAEQTHLYS
jgi:hypothetical protein